MARGEKMRLLTVDFGMEERIFHDNGDVEEIVIILTHSLCVSHVEMIACEWSK